MSNLSTHVCVRDKNSAVVYNFYNSNYYSENWSLKFIIIIRRFLSTFQVENFVKIASDVENWFGRNNNFGEIIIIGIIDTVVLLIYRVATE